MAGALIALRVCPALGGDKGYRPFPRTPFSASSILPSLRFGQVSLDEAEHFLHNRDASVATLRWCSGSSRNAVRLPSGTSVQLHRNPQKLRFLRPFTSLRRDVPFWNVASGLEPLCQIAIQMGLRGEESLAITL